MIHNAYRRLTACFCIVFLLVSLPGCEWYAQNKGTEPVTITISYTGVDAARDYIMHLKERFPDIHIEPIANESDAATIQETDGLLEYQAEHLSVSDITISNSLDKNLPNLTEAFADLSGKDYSANYQTSYLNDVAMNGAVYYFPFYLTVKGLICNKSLFDEKGWTFPKSYEEFSALLETINSDPDGINPIYDEHSVNTIPYWMSVYYALNEGAILSGYEALRDFNNTFDTSRLELSNTLSYMSLLAETGCLSEDTLNKVEETEAAVKKGYYSLGRRETAMAFGSGMTWTVLKNRGFTDEFVVLPLYSPNCPEGYVLEQQTLNIGVSKKAMEDPRKEAVIDELMRYITSQVGQQKLLEYSSGIKSPCYGIMDVESRKFMEGILPTLQNGYIVQAVDFRPVDVSFDQVIVEYLFHNEDGHLTEQDVIDALNHAANLQHTTGLEDEKAVAEVTHDFTYAQTIYLLLDAMVRETGADFAVMPQTEDNNYYGAASRSKAFRCSFLSGTLSARNIRSLIIWDTPVQVYRITGDQLLKLMDYNTSILMICGARMEYTYDQNGDTYRTTGATLPDGSKLEPEGEYTLVASETITVPNELEPLEIEDKRLLSDMLIAYCKRIKTILPPEIPEPQYIK